MPQEQRSQRVTAIWRGDESPPMAWSPPLKRTFRHGRGGQLCLQSYLSLPVGQRGTNVSSWPDTQRQRKLSGAKLPLRAYGARRPTQRQSRGGLWAEFLWPNL